MEGWKWEGVEGRRVGRVKGCRAERWKVEKLVEHMRLRDIYEIYLRYIHEGQI